MVSTPVPDKTIRTTTFGYIKELLLPGSGPSGYPDPAGSAEKAACLQITSTLISGWTANKQAADIADFKTNISTPRTMLGSPFDESYKIESPPPGPGGTFSDTKQQANETEKAYNRNLSSNIQSSPHTFQPKDHVSQYIEKAINQIENLSQQVYVTAPQCYYLRTGKILEDFFSYFDKYTKYKCEQVPKPNVDNDETLIQNDEAKIAPEVTHNIAVPIFRTLISGVYLDKWGPNTSLYSLGKRLTEDSEIVIRKIYIDNELVYVNGKFITDTIQNIAIPTKKHKIYSHLYVVIITGAFIGDIAFEVDELDSIEVEVTDTIDGELTYGSNNYLLYKDPSGTYYNLYDGKKQPISFPNATDPNIKAVALDKILVWGNSVYIPSLRQLDSQKLFVQGKCGQLYNRLYTLEHIYDTETQQLFFTPFSRPLINDKYDIVGDYVITPKYFIQRGILFNKIAYTYYFDFDRVLTNENSSLGVLLKLNPSTTKLKFVLLDNYSRMKRINEHNITLSYPIIPPHPNANTVISQNSFLTVRKDTGDIINIDCVSGEVTHLGIKLPNSNQYKNINFLRHSTHNAPIDSFTIFAEKNAGGIDRLEISNYDKTGLTRNISIALQRILGNRVVFDTVDTALTPMLGAALSLNKSPVEHAKRIANSVGLYAFNDSGRLRVTRQDYGVETNNTLLSILDEYQGDHTSSWPTKIVLTVSNESKETAEDEFRFRYFDPQQGIFTILKTPLPPGVIGATIASDVTLPLSLAENIASYFKSITINVDNIDNTTTKENVSLPFNITLKHFTPGKTLIENLSLNHKSWKTKLPEIIQGYKPFPTGLYPFTSDPYTAEYGEFSYTTLYQNIPNIGFPILDQKYEDFLNNFFVSLLPFKPQIIKHGELLTPLRCYLTSSSRHIGFSYKDFCYITIDKTLLDAGEFSLSSAEYTDLLKDPHKNLMCVSRKEWIQYSQVEQISDTVYKLSGFLRGRFGTLYNITHPSQLSQPSPIFFYSENSLTEVKEFHYVKQPAKISVYDNLKPDIDTKDDYDIAIGQLIRFQYLRINHAVNNITQIFDETFFTGSKYTKLKMYPNIEKILQDIKLEDIIELSNPTNPDYPDLTDMHTSFFLNRGYITSLDPMVYTIPVNDRISKHHVAYTLGPKKTVEVHRGNDKISPIRTNKLDGEYVDHFIN